MSKSVLIVTLALAAASLASCSTANGRKSIPPPLPGRSTTLEVTKGIKVLTNVEMPEGFEPIATRPPIWLQQGEEIGVIGTQAGHTIMYGLGGAAWRTGRILAAETGPAAAEKGTIEDLAANPNGLTLATAMVAPDGNRVDVIIRDLIATGPGNVIASFNGRYDSISMSWLNNATIALALRRRPEPLEAGVSGEAAKSEPTEASEEPPPNRADGLQLIVVTGAGSVAPLKFSCPMSALSWSTHGVYAVGQGDAGAAPVIFDRRNSTCSKFHVREPIQVLDWDPDDEGSFLYAAREAAGGTIGVFKYNIATGADNLMGVSTGASAFAGSSHTITLGNQKLTFKTAVEHPEAPLLAQLAIARPEQSAVDLKPLGFDSEPQMFAQSTMEYSRSASEVAIQTYTPSLPVAWRRIVTYSLKYDSAFILAQGPARGTVTMSWSPRGRWLAFLDGDATAGTVMTVLTPPR
jgi:hypothetical protein